MTSQNLITRRAFLALAVSSIVWGGCGGTNEKGLVPVSGRITLDGGSWPKPGKITFVPIDKGVSGSSEMRPASADFDTSGNFTVTSYDGVPGLYPGDYWGSVECWEVAPGMADPSAAKATVDKKGSIPGAGKSYVPKKYQSSESSGISLKVEAGHAVAATFDVKSK